MTSGGGAAGPLLRVVLSAALESSLLLGNLSNTVDMMICVVPDRQWCAPACTGYICVVDFHISSLLCMCMHLGCTRVSWPSNVSMLYEDERGYDC